MKKKEIKGYLTLSIATILVLSACSAKKPPTTTVPTAPPVQSIDPNSLDIPGITDTPTTTTPDTTTPATTTPDTTTPATTATTDPATTTPTAVATATTDPATAVSPTATATTDPAVSPTATPTATATAALTCEAKITGDLNGLAGGIVQLTAKNQCSDGTTKDDTFSWSSSDPAIATVDSSGKVTGVKAGNINITATSNANASVKSSVQFKVGATCSIALSGDLKNIPEVGLGSSKQLIGTVSCNDGTTNTSNISWSTGDSSIATVSTSGLVEGKKKGSTKITATYKTDSSVSTGLDITVNDPYGNEVKNRLSENKLHIPSGIDVRNGKIYVAHHDTSGLDEGESIIYDTSGAQVGRVAGSTLDLLPTSITAVVSDGSRVFITNRTRANQSANNIYSFDTAGGNRKNAGIGLSSGTDLRDMAVDPSTKTLYVANGLGYVTKLTYDDSGLVNAGGQQLYFINGVNPAGIGLDNYGNIFITNASNGTIIKYGKDGTKSLEFGTNGTNSTGPTATAIGDVAYDGNKGIIYVLAKVGGSNVILRYDSDGRFVRSFGADAGMINPKAMAVSTDGTLYVADWGTLSDDNQNKGIIHQFSAGK